MVIRMAAMRLFGSVLLALLFAPSMMAAQAVKGSVTIEDGPPGLTYHGLIPGLHDGTEARRVLGEPAFAAIIDRLSLETVR